uniref:Uncharacterized protein n=1 Tax=Timema cristinae TaxID=61476 RepID=A0A7R9CF31_TIMCR|nr:unnamed protein product [Timema cristinae]
MLGVYIVGYFKYPVMSKAGVVADQFLATSLGPALAAGSVTAACAGQLCRSTKGTGRDSDLIVTTEETGQFCIIMDCTQALECTQALDEFSFEDSRSFKPTQKVVVGHLTVEGVKHKIYSGENIIGRDVDSCNIVLHSKDFVTNELLCGSFIGSESQKSLLLRSSLDLISRFVLSGMCRPVRKLVPSPVFVIHLLLLMRKDTFVGCEATPCLSPSHRPSQKIGFRLALDRAKGLN